MARLIDANLLLEWVGRLEAYNMGRRSCLQKPKGLTPEGVRHMIDTMPKVDAVEVVRCMDCKHWRRDTFSCDFSPYGKIYEAPNWYEEDFCSYGERKTDG